MALTQTLRCLAVLNPSAAPREQVMNTWHIATRDAVPPLTAISSFQGALEDFYQSVQAYLTSELNGVTPHFRWYNLIEPKPRVPIVEYDYVGTLATSSQAGVREVCCVVSYRAEYVSGVTPKRRRGRIYLGPMAANSLSTTDGLFSSSCVTAVKNAADALVTDSDGSANYAWVVYSPTTDTSGTGETGMYEVISGWVDNNPDIQRRRGAAGGTRSNWAP